MKANQKFVWRTSVAFGIGALLLTSLSHGSALEAESISATERRNDVPTSIPERSLENSKTLSPTSTRVEVVRTNSSEAARTVITDADVADDPPFAGSASTVALLRNGLLLLNNADVAFVDEGRLKPLVRPAGLGHVRVVVPSGPEVLLVTNRKSDIATVSAIDLRTSEFRKVSEFRLQRYHVSTSVSSSNGDSVAILEGWSHAGHSEGTLYMSHDRGRSWLTEDAPGYGGIGFIADELVITMSAEAGGPSVLKRSRNGQWSNIQKPFSGDTFVHPSSSDGVLVLTDGVRLSQIDTDGSVRSRVEPTHVDEILLSVQHARRSPTARLAHGSGYIRADGGGLFVSGSEVEITADSGKSWQKLPLTEVQPERTPTTIL